MENVDVSLVNRKIEKMLRAKQNVVKATFDMEAWPFLKRTDWLLQILQLLLQERCPVYRVLHWEKDRRIQDALESIFSQNSLYVVRPYKNKQTPGIIVISEKEYSANNLSYLCQLHMNFEQAIDPSLNMRLQIYLPSGNREEVLFDIYDDRGFHAYWMQ